VQGATQGDDGARQRLKNAIAEVPGVADLGIVKSGEVPQIQVKPDRLALAPIMAATYFQLVKNLSRYHVNAWIPRRGRRGRRHGR
jgi:hypothetical protein